MSAVGCGCGLPAGDDLPSIRNCVAAAGSCRPPAAGGSPARSDDDQQRWAIRCCQRQRWTTSPLRPGSWRVERTVHFPCPQDGCRVQSDEFRSTPHYEPAVAASGDHLVADAEALPAVMQGLASSLGWATVDERAANDRAGCVSTPLAQHGARPSRRRPRGARKGLFTVT